LKAVFQPGVSPLPYSVERCSKKLVWVGAFMIQSSQSNGIFLDAVVRLEAELQQPAVGDVADVELGVGGGEPSTSPRLVHWSMKASSRSTIAPAGVVDALLGLVVPDARVLRISSCRSRIMHSTWWVSSRIDHSTMVVIPFISPRVWKLIRSANEENSCIPSPKAEKTAMSTARSAMPLPLSRTNMYSCFARIASYSWKARYSTSGRPSVSISVE
jgi:hypothetical protein